MRWRKHDEHDYIKKKDRRGTFMEFKRRLYLSINKKRVILQSTEHGSGKNGTPKTF